MSTKAGDGRVWAAMPPCCPATLQDCCELLTCTGPSKSKTVQLEAPDVQSDRHLSTLAQGQVEQEQCCEIGRGSSLPCFNLQLDSRNLGLAGKSGTYLLLAEPRLATPDKDEAERLDTMRCSACVCHCAPLQQQQQNQKAGLSVANEGLIAHAQAALW